ncbi:synaptonemal complex protein 2-like isoform X3 [Hypomesus transpacificus]|uniref:synaptonemal complex protein 2-like isoform X3 n=1 Tax=Hypomesus transpacificus TaxID=137520 RepID=UPI001F083945|nr:synaptonemal complex protein 2-like isoform X3 [Hypomesus transpacificus]
MDFEKTLENAFAGGNVGAITAAVLAEGASKSLVTTLSKVAFKEIDVNRFNNVTMLLKSIENVSEMEEDFANLAKHGLVVKISSWFESALKALKERGGAQELHTLLEAFYDFFLLVCQITIEGKGQWTSLFLLQLGGVVTDSGVKFDLRLEAIRTFNAILDKMTREERKKLNLSSDHSLLLGKFGKGILHVGDYEMQVSLSEALCRMTARKWRKDLATGWFSNPAFASSFSIIKDGEFEVLFKPEDDNLEQYWIDFNLGSSCVSFFINDPEASLWESVHLTREIVYRYCIRDWDDQTVLTIHLTNAISHHKTKGRMVKIFFDSCQPILEAAKMVFHASSLVPYIPEKHQPSPADPINILSTDFQKGKPKQDACPVEGSGGMVQDLFQLPDNSSDTEVNKAKSHLFSQSGSSDGYVFTPDCELLLCSVLTCLPVACSSSHCTPENKEKPAWQQSLGETGGGMPRSKLNYSRKKPRTKIKLKILPLSSPSSTDETRPVKSAYNKGISEQLFDKHRDQTMEIPHSVKMAGIDSGFPDITTHQDDEKQYASTPMVFAPSQNPPAPRKRLLSDCCEMPSIGAKMKRNMSGPGLKPRVLFPSSPLEEATESLSRTLVGDVESETEMGSGVITAFQTFKTQLRAHFSSRYKQIEAQSQQALTDCQQNVSSLLSAVHHHRLGHLERFQATVVQELGRLEDDCLSLKTIEKETVSFWQRESQAVKLFCDHQQKRLTSYESRENGQTEASDFVVNPL